MSVKKENAAYLDAVRNCFIANRLDPANSKNGLRWGQFLDTNKPGSQAGLYGAIAAAISLKSGDKASWPDAQGAQAELLQYWTNRAKIDGAEDNLCQNIRLAASFLGLCFGMDGNNAAIKEVSDHLLAHRNPQGNLWAEYAVDMPVQVIEEAEYASALVLIFSSCGVYFMAENREAYSNFAAELKKSAVALQDKYLNDPGQRRPHLGAMLIAIILVLGSETNKQVRNRFRQDFVFARPELATRLVHYLDFKRSDGTYGRDYFIAPLNLFSPLLLLQPDLTGLEYLYAVKIAESMRAAVDESKIQGLFGEGVMRPSSIEQSLFVLALEAANRKIKQGPKLWCAIVWEQLRRERERGDMALAWIIIAFLYIPFALGSSEDVLTGQYASHIPHFLAIAIGGLSLVPKSLFAAALIAVGAVRKPQDVAKQALGKK